MPIDQYVFDDELQDWVSNPALNSDNPKVSPYDELSVEIIQEDVFNDFPGGSSNDILQPPDTFEVIEQITRNNPDGSTTVDVIIEVFDNANKQYEARITR